MQEIQDNLPFCQDPRWSTTRLVHHGPTAAPENESARADEGVAGGLRLRGLVKQSLPKQPLISIVTVVLNRAESLAQTIESVIEQDYDNVEYIIVDGGSSDGSLEIVRRYEHTIDYWRSAPDRGIYDAMNQGIRLASGSLIGIVNADDWYNPGVLRQAARLHQENQHAVCHGAMTLFDHEKPYCNIPAPRHFAGLKKGMIINHPTVFVPASVYEQFGTFDSNLKIVADWELMIRLWQANVPFQTMPGVTANFRLGGISHNLNRRQIEEKHQIRVRHKLAGRWDWHWRLDRGKQMIPARWLMRATLWKRKWLGG